MAAKKKKTTNLNKKNRGENYLEKVGRDEFAFLEKRVAALEKTRK